MKKFMETSIPEIYSRGLDDEKCLTVGSNHVDKVATVLFTAVSNCLKDLKSKEKPAVFKFTDLKDDIIAPHKNTKGVDANIIKIKEIISKNPKIKQKQIAEMIGKSQGYVSNIIRNYLD